MKFKLTNDCERNIAEFLPEVIRFNLAPGEAIVVTKSEYDAISLARGIRGMKDFLVEKVLEDHELANVLKKKGF